MARIARLLSLLGAALLLFVARPLRAADDETDRAELAFKDGNRAFAAGDYHAAFDAYRAAWSLKQTFDIACNLGRTEVELALARDAAEHLDFCLRTFSVSSRGEVRDANKRFRELFARVRREVAALSVDAHPAGAEISVDGASYGLAPLKYDLFLDPGEHRVRARLSGFQDQERVVIAEAGGAVKVSMTLEHATPAIAATPVVAAPREEAPPPSHGIEPRTVALIAGSGLSLVALGIGVGFTLDASAARDDAKSLGKKIHAGPSGGCADPALPECQELLTLVNRQGDSRHAADVALVTGAAIEGATLLAWLLIPDLAPARKAGELRALPLVGRHSSGILLTGAY